MADPYVWAPAVPFSSTYFRKLLENGPGFSADDVLQAMRGRVGLF